MYKSNAELHARIIALALITLAAAQLWPIQAQSTVRLPAAKLEAIERLISAEIERQRIPGLSVAIANDLVPVLSRGYGMADLENEVRVQPGTVFRIASISKPITAVAVLQLAERGKLNLDAPIQRYVPSFPEKNWPVTARMLLGHLSGIRHYANRPEVDSTRHYENILEPLQIFARDPLRFEPGTAFLYTTYGYNLLGAAVEAASGQNFMEYLHENVFKPAGMEKTSQDNVYRLIPHRARGYRKNGSGLLENCALADTSNKIAGGGMVSTADDLIRFVTALNRGRLLKPATVEQMFTPLKIKNKRVSSYGLGWFITERNGRKWVEHTGSQQGTSTDLIVLPSRGLAVAVLSNLEGANIRGISLQLAGIVMQ